LSTKHTGYILNYGGTLRTNIVQAGERRNLPLAAPETNLVGEIRYSGNS